MTRRIRYVSAALDSDQVPPAMASRCMETFMLRNFATTGWTFHSHGLASIPGCIIASPSRPDESDVTDQEYDHVWVRDAAICALAASRSTLPLDNFLKEYVAFSRVAQVNAEAGKKTPGHACFEIDGSVRDWSEQNDGPAMQLACVLEIYDRLPAQTKPVAKEVVRADLEYVLNVFEKPTMNAWEETVGHSFFARAVQLRALKLARQHLLSLGLGSLDTRVGLACERLVSALAEHWDPGAHRYRSILGAGNGRGADLNSDVVMAAVYGDLPCTDGKLLATAAQVRDVFAREYKINEADRERRMGPSIGRYPEDTYDGDVTDPSPDFGHPWALCTCNFAELYYRVAATARSKGQLVVDDSTRPFFRQIGVEDAGRVEDSAAIDRIVEALVRAGDQMMKAVLYHSDHLELSEQFDRDT
jgi:glucoamylase